MTKFVWIMKFRTVFLFSFLLTSLNMEAQDYLSPTPPMIKAFQGIEGKVTKNHFFNFIKVKDESGEKERQSTGHYWEVSYLYDSVFRQKEMFSDFMEKQITDLGGVLFYKDTSSIHFAIPRDTGGNLWGNVLLTSDKLYRLKLIEERVFVNKLVFDTLVQARFDEFVEAVEMPPRMNFLPSTLITRARYSKFNHLNINYTDKNQSFSQTLMGPYWDLKLEVVTSDGEVDTRISPVEIMESYYRACVKHGGKIIKSRPRELIFNLPVGSSQKLWVRIVTSMDGLYFAKMVLQDDQDETPPKGIGDASGR